MLLPILQSYNQQLNEGTYLLCIQFFFKKCSENADTYFNAFSNTTIQILVLNPEVMA